jgi:hypothetical protein
MGGNKKGFTLTVRLTGLCTYILKTKQPDKNAMRVIMPSASCYTMGMPMEPHVPALVFDECYVDPSSQRPYETFLSGPKGSPTVAFCRLDGQDLTIGRGPDDLKPDLTPVKYPCPTKKDKASLLWLAQIQNVLAEYGSGYGDIDHCCLDASNVPATVGARIRLTEGTLCTSKIFSAGYYSVIFAAGRWEQAFAEELELTLKVVDADTFTFSTSSFLVDADYSSLVLKPKDGSIQVKIVNLPEDDIKMARLPQMFIVGRPRKADRHFQMFYPLSFQGMPNGQAPIPFPIKPCTEYRVPFVAGNPQCPGASYPPHPGA